MMRSVISATAICVALNGPAFAQGRDPFVGTFRGPTLIIAMQRSRGSYNGVGTSSNGQYQLRAQKIGPILLGSYMDGGAAHAFQIAVQGDVMQFSSEGANITLQRQSGSAAVAGSPPASPAPKAGGRGSVAATPQDRQLAQLLLSSRWCAFSYSQTSGTSHTERVQYFSNGTVTQSTGGETYNSGQNGTVAGQSRGGRNGMWRVQGGVLMLSEDGQTWTPQPLQVTRNSNGYPIVNANGKEYSQCN
ncbi:MAG: hypothetical protein ACHQU1_10045 [Gemmatimonadales bacterium]